MQCMRRWMDTCNIDNWLDNRGFRKWSLSGNNATDNSFIGTLNNKPLVFKTNNIIRGQFTSGGDLQINKQLTVGTRITTPDLRITGLARGLLAIGDSGRLINTSLLHDTVMFAIPALKVTNQIQIGDSSLHIAAYNVETGFENSIYTTNNDLFIQSSTDYEYNTIINANNNGNTGIGNNAPHYKLDVGGDINFTGSLLTNGVPYSMPGLWQGSAADGWRIEAAGVEFNGTHYSGPYISLEPTQIIEWGGVGMQTVAGGWIRFAPGLGEDDRQAGVLFVDNPNGSAFQEFIMIKNGKIGINKDIMGIESAQLSLGGSAEIDGNLRTTTFNANTATITNLSFTNLKYGSSDIGLWLKNPNGIHYAEPGKNVGINTNAPAHTLDVNGDINFTGNLLKNGAALDFTGLWNANNSGLYYNQPAKAIGIGTDAPVTKLHLNNGVLTIDGTSPLPWTKLNLQTRIVTPLGSVWRSSDNTADGSQLGIAMTADGWRFIKARTDGSGDYKNAAYITNEGGLYATMVEVKIENWQDAVFADEYKLPTLHEVEQYIKAHKHLPDVPSEQEVKKEGVNLGEMDGILMKKIEELTLYTIELSKRVEQLEKENAELKKK